MNRVDLTSFIPPDKSSLIRHVLFSLLTDEKVSVYYNSNLSLDVMTAFKCLKKFGKSIRFAGDTADISGVAIQPDCEIDCENSATVMHLLMGIATYRKWLIDLSGDASLMKRNHSDFYEARKMYDSSFVKAVLSKESAQLKSYHLISMLKYGGKLEFKTKTRRNTEELLTLMGAEIVENENSIEVKPLEKLKGYSVKAKLDPSSAFIAACCALIAQKSFVISGIYPEKLRMIPFEYLAKAGYNISVFLKNNIIEVSGTSSVSKKVNMIDISENEVPGIIDEIPFIAYMAARVGITFSLKNGKWLRNKESDRIKGSVERFKLFFYAFENEDGFSVNSGPASVSGQLCHSDDHRMEMLASMIAFDKKIPFVPNASYNVSFPMFMNMIEKLSAE